jgi:hypothetical protein
MEGNGMAKAPASDSIMAADKMKPLLALSKKEPVQAAIGLTSDGEGIILLDKKAKPKKVFSMLKASASKAKIQLNTSSLRFGRAEVDTDYDAGMVRFFINKDAPGNMRVKLVEVVKRIPYQKVELNVDATLEQEPEDDTESEQTAASGAATQTPEPTVRQPPVAPPPPTANVAALRRILGGLIPRIPEAAGNDAARRATLLKFANDANEALKSENVADAAHTIAQLRDALATQTQGPTTNGQAAQPPAAGIWNDAKEAVDQQLNGLYAVLKKTGIPVLNEIAGEIEEVLGKFRVGLTTALMNYDQATGQAKDQARSVALKTVNDYKTAIPADKHVNAADNNPFGVSITVRQTLGAALDRLSQQLGT